MRCSWNPFSLCEESLYTPGGMHLQIRCGNIKFGSALLLSLHFWPNEAIDKKTTVSSLSLLWSCPLSLFGKGFLCILVWGCSLNDSFWFIRLLMGINLLILYWFDDNTGLLNNLKGWEVQVNRSIIWSACNLINEWYEGAFLIIKIKKVGHGDRTLYIFFSLSTNALVSKRFMNYHHGRMSIMWCLYLLLCLQFWCSVQGMPSRWKLDGINKHQGCTSETVGISL